MCFSNTKSLDAIIATLCYARVAKDPNSLQEVGNTAFIPSRYLSLFILNQTTLFYSQNSSSLKNIWEYFAGNQKVGFTVCTPKHKAI